MEDFSLPLAEDEGISIKTSNRRTILHFDIDCFYAQVFDKTNILSLNDQIISVKIKKGQMTMKIMIS